MNLLGNADNGSPMKKSSAALIAYSQNQVGKQSQLTRILEGEIGSGLSGSLLSTVKKSSEPHNLEYHSPLKPSIVKDFGFANTQVVRNAGYIDTNLIDKQLEGEQSLSIEEPVNRSNQSRPEHDNKSKDYYSARLSPYLSNHGRSKSNLIKPQSPFFLPNAPNVQIFNYHVLQDENAQQSRQQVLSKVPSQNKPHLSPINIANRVATLQNQERQLSQNELDGLLLQKSMSIKIELEKKLS